MRLTNLYQMYDLEAKATYGAIIQDKSPQSAIRAFYEVLNRGHEQLPGRYPAHFELRQVGVQDEETGQVTAESPPVKITDGSAWLAVQTLRETDANRRD